MSQPQWYLEAVRGFTPWFAAQAQPEITYIAPGDSAKTMIDMMLGIAQQSNIALPMIRILSHDESSALYYEYDSYFAGELISQLSVKRKLYFIDDFAYRRDKIHDIQESLYLDFQVKPVFYVMIWSSIFKESENVHPYITNETFAYLLNKKWDRRRRENPINRKNGLSG